MAKFNESNLPAWRDMFARNRERARVRHGLGKREFLALCEALLRFHDVAAGEGGGHFRECTNDKVARALWLTRVSAEAARDGRAALDL